MAIKDFSTFKPGDVGVKRAEKIRQFIVQALSVDEFRDISGRAESEFHVTRQAVNKQLKRLEENGVIEGRGRTQGREYRLTFERFDTQRRIAGLREYDLWEEFALPHLKSVRENVLGILRYGFTEIVNNAIDHSESETVDVRLERSPKKIRFVVADAGVGIFHKIQSALQLPSAQEAVFELQKGGFTTDPTRHSGEGIFFTSRMLDSFSLISRGIYLGHKREGDDWMLGEDDASEVGTAVFLEIDPDSAHTMDEVYQHYSVPRKDMNFNRTHVVLSLLQSGENTLVSRSQAKRVLTRLPRFKEVMLDFEGVNTIGQAFADEIFRVFARAHPDVRLIPMNTTEEVTRMIDRAQARPEADLAIPDTDSSVQRGDN
jgi:hypothetical protein